MLASLRTWNRLGCQALICCRVGFGLEAVARANNVKTMTQGGCHDLPNNESYVGWRNCANEDDAFDEAAFVIATAPKAGERVESCFEVKGCSRSFESNVQWKLVGRDGSVLASGNTQGGGVDGPGSFSFTIPYNLTVQQIGHLEVFDEDPSDGEGFPPGRTVLPLVLKP